VIFGAIEEGPERVKQILNIFGIRNNVNLLGDNIDPIKKNAEILMEVSKEVGLEVKEEKTKYMLLSRHQTARQSHDKDN
jgi:hypothetical protein